MEATAANFHRVFDRVCRSTGRDLSIDRSATGQSPFDEWIRSLVRENRESEESAYDVERRKNLFFFFLIIGINRNYKN